MKLSEIHNKLTKNGFSLKNAKSNKGFEERKWKGDFTDNINEITSWLDDEILEVTIKTANLPTPLKVTYKKEEK
jgi:hypothetical protein